MSSANDPNLLVTCSNEKPNEEVNNNLDAEEYPSVDTDEGREPTEQEMSTLRHVSSSIPLSCWLVAIVELAERFSYFGLAAPFQNYMQRTQTESPKIGRAHV